MLRLEQARVDLIEQAEGAFLLFRFGFRLRSLGSCLAGSGRRSSSSGGSGRKSSGVLENLLDLLGLGEIIARFNGDGEQVLEGICEDVGKRSLVGDSCGKTNGSNVLDGRTEEAADICGGDIQDGGRQNRAVIVNLADDETVREGADVELVQQSHLRSLAFVALGQDRNVAHDFDGTLVNLSRDLQGLKKRGLCGLKTSGAGRHNDGALCYAADASRSLLAVGKDDGTNLKKTHENIGTDRMKYKRGRIHREDPRW